LKDNRQIAAAIDLRVQQLAVQGVSDSALVDQMIGYMSGLQRLWTSTTDEELAALCRDYPGFARYATLMEEVSEAMRTGVGVPAGIKQLPPLPDHLKRALEKLLTDGAALECGLQQQSDESSAGRSKANLAQCLPHETFDLDALYRQWRPAIAQLVAEVRAAELPQQTQRLMLQALENMASRIDSLQGR
jgi:hypothetical protein